MAFVTMSVRGVKRNVSVPEGTKLSAGSEIHGKTRVNGKTVRGLITVNKVGAKKFTPTGTNANLI